MANSREYRHHFAVAKAAEADTGGSGISLRKGKWTVEEENYANKIIDLFNQGLLPIAAGTTLRTYLSEKLACDPMRITKKFAGASCIGKQVFQPYERAGAEDLMNLFRQSEKELALLEERFLSKIRSKRGSATYLSSQLTDKPYGTRNISGNSKINDSLLQTSPIPESSSIELDSHRNKKSRTDNRKRIDVIYKTGILEQVEENDDDEQESDESASEPEDSFNAYHYALGGSAVSRYLADKEDNMTSASHALGEEYLRQFHLHMQQQSLNEDSNTQPTKGRRGRPPLSVSYNTRCTEAVSSTDSGNILKSSFRFGKRVKSAPNLAHHDRSVDFLNIKSRIGRERNTDISMESDSHYSTVSSQLVHSTSSVSGIHGLSSRGPKRSHSVMALMEFEKFINDDHAADDLFLEFVQSVNNDREQNGEKSVSLPKALAIQKLGINSTSSTQETTVDNINLKMSGNSIGRTDEKIDNHLAKLPSTHSLSSGVTTSSATGSHCISATSSMINDTSNLDVSKTHFPDQLSNAVVSSSSEHQKRIIDSANTASADGNTPSDIESHKKENISMGNVTIALEASSLSASSHVFSSTEFNALKCDITDSTSVQVTEDSKEGALYIDQSRRSSSLEQDIGSNLEEQPMYDEGNFF